MNRNIHILHNSETLMFAAGELAKYLRLLSDTPVTCTIGVVSKVNPSEITLGLYGNGLGVSPSNAHPFDDAVTVDIINGKGFIAGINERSVLLGVYRFLQELGCRWVRPGIYGEYVPRIDITKATVHLEKKASFRHRTICIEGSVSVENVLEMIDWAPKAGFSGYFMQFPFGNTFFEKYYTHPANPFLESEFVSNATARHFTITIEREIKRRGLLYHAVGHGWTCKAIGLDIAHWDPLVAPLAPAIKALLAETNGKREFQWDRPMITSLCFSNSEVQKRMTDAIVTYAHQHLEVDLLHVWLDDGGNNKCECSACRKENLADLYVKMLKQIGKELDQAGSKLKIVFLSYSDLLWPPVLKKASLDTDRFVFMYANSRTSYTEPLRKISGCTVPKFTLNKNVIERDMNAFNAFLEGWQKFYKGDSFLFEYYMTIGRLAFDPFGLARIIHEDIRNLNAFGLNGITSCQMQRVFFPVGLAMYVMGEMLWNRDRSFDDLANEYFLASFGSDSGLCKDFIKVSGEEMNRIVTFDSRMTVIPGSLNRIEKLERSIGSFQKIVDRNLCANDLCHSRSWHFMQWHLRILTRLLGLFKIIHRQVPQQEVLECWSNVKKYIAENESSYQAVFDVELFLGTMDGYMVNGVVATAPEETMRN